jgi:hypothetical protein
MVQDAMDLLFLSMHLLTNCFLLAFSAARMIIAFQQ